MKDLILRKYKASDQNFILNSWLKSARNTPEFTNVSNDIYYKHYAAYILKNIEHTVLLVELLDPDFIYGYICVDHANKVIHFTYLKYTFRKLGIAKKLFEVAHPDYTALFYHPKNKHPFNPFIRK